uniref:Uncharacterized protein n=1 Tax=Tanacetum cinerariifolium TaxID=118510 RepID=A0A699J3X7_TANCI|nr:hypothetical protein [Tanacetum cinerariifolium]
MEALIKEQNAIDVADIVKDHKRKHDDNEVDDDKDPLAGSNQEKEPVEEPIAEVIMDDAGDDVFAYDKDAKKGIKYWGERRKLWYRSQIRKFSKQNVYSTKAILGVKSISVKKLHKYGHLEEIMVKGSDQQLYKFKEGDFVDLDLNNIKDMLLLAVQHKLFHLDGSDIVDFIVALHMFTRSLILKRRVKDLKLGVESYQKKLNITKLQKTFPEIDFKEPYAPSYDPPEIVYKDLDKEKRVLQADELYKFLDGTLKSVRDEIHHKVLDFRLDYNKDMPKEEVDGG